ncbi:MAG: LEA type 2 family protein [Treponema sp.]|jgi:LEA14-like dessication related protein|nr:LEA type 2 family protein [Treponema sp.]
MKKFLLAASCGIFLLGFGCKTSPAPPPAPPPASQPDPSAFLSFAGVDAPDVDHVGMEFKLSVENPRSDPARASVESLKVEINGLEAEEGIRILPETALLFPVDGAFPQGNGESLPGSAAIALRMELDLETLSKMGLSLADDYQVKILAALDLRYGAGPPVRITALENAVFPRIKKPVFTITDIAVFKAELINTRFRVRLKIENPNPFPMELSAFRYELYGSGRFWADGKEKDVLRIPARDSAEAKLFLVMNFMGMKRDILDQVAAFQNVRYRFTGEALVTTGIDYLPRFPSGFDLSGYSEVFE